MTPNEGRGIYPLIINPNARGSHTRRLRAWVQSRADRFYIHEPESPEALRLWVREKAARMTPVIVAAGGDGTLNIVADELRGTETAMGIIPAGTMNVFARELKFPMHGFESSLNVLDGGKVREVDMFTANGRAFLQMCGVGFDAQIVENVTWQSKKAWGPLAYVFSAFRVLTKRPPSLLVSLPGGETRECVFAVMGNGGLYGGPFRLFPKAEPDDGVLDLLLFRKLGLSVLGEFRRALFSKTSLPSSSHVEYLRVKACDIAATEKVPYELDGDSCGDAPVRIRLAPGKLKVIVP